MPDWELHGQYSQARAHTFILKYDCATGPNGIASNTMERFGR